jgi:hypothetical protein
MQKLIIILVLQKNAIFFLENCRKLQKIVIITSTPVFYGNSDTDTDIKYHPHHFPTLSLEHEVFYVALDLPIHSLQTVSDGQDNMKILLVDYFPMDVINATLLLHFLLYYVQPA